jgi:hypothetical protein
MEKYAELAASAQFACTILGNTGTWDIMVLRIPYQPKDLRDQMAGRGLRFLGVAAVVNGVVCAEFTRELELCPEMLTIASLGFHAEMDRWLAGEVPTLDDSGELTAASLTHFERVERAGSVLWLEALLALPDTRG